MPRGITLTPVDNGGLDSQEPAAQIARLEAYIAWALAEVAELNVTDTQSTRILVLSQNITAARQLLLKLIRHKDVS